MPTERGAWGPGGWGRGGWGEGRRPPWWPEGEAWPPTDGEAWRGMRRRFARRAAGVALVVLTALVVIVGAVAWLLTTAFGSGWTVVPAILVAILVISLIGRGVLRTIRGATAPIADLVEASGRLEAGEPVVPIRERGPGEVRQLIRAFNGMSRRLADDAERRKRLLAEVSHELRTPLTVIAGNVEGMIDGLYPADRTQLERVLTETRQMERLVEDLRTLALADAGALPLHREAIDLGLVARDVVEGFATQAAEAGVALSLEVAETIPELQLDASRWRQVIGNLLANALRHTPAGGSVRVRVEGVLDALVLEVADSGAGMDADASAHAFDRFWRSGDAAGAGLGLAIVRDLVELHGGTVTLDSEVGMGTSVRCRVPRPIG